MSKTNKCSMFESIRSWDAITEINSIDIPFYLFAGKNDYIAPLLYCEKCIDSIKSPHKELLVFENSAHLPFISEKEKFFEEMKKIIT